MRKLILISILFLSCIRPPCPNPSPINFNEAVGYYESWECKECAGWGVGSTMSDLELKNDSTFLYRYLAVRYGMNDAVVIMSNKGNWKLNRNKLVLYLHELIANKVDSVYSLIPNGKIIYKHLSGKLYMRFCDRGNKIVPNDKELNELIKKDNKRFFPNLKQ